MRLLLGHLGFLFSLPEIGGFLSEFNLQKSERFYFHDFYRIGEWIGGVVFAVLILKKYPPYNTSDKGLTRSSFIKFEFIFCPSCESDPYAILQRHPAHRD